MLTLSRKVQSVEESQTLALAAKAKRMKSAGLDIVSLTAGEPDFPTPRHVKEAAIKAIEANFTRYTPGEGTPELLQAVVRKFSRENSLHFEPDQILVSTGAKQCIYNALQAICNKGDEVVVISPYWVSYPEMVRMVDATPVFVKTTIDRRFIPDVRDIRKAVNAKTKALILNSPNNPTGAVYPRSLLEEIGALVKDAGIYVISDEIYEKIVYDDCRHWSIGSFTPVRDQVISVNGVSKAFSMTGWRIGYMGGPVAVIEAARKIQSQVTSNANSIAQLAAVAALNGSTNDLDTMVAEFRRRRDASVDLLSGIRNVKVVSPPGAFYVFFGVEQYYGTSYDGGLIRNSAAISEYLLLQHNVATIPGSAFGDDTCLRMSYACSMAELEKGLTRIRAGLEKLH